MDTTKQNQRKMGKKTKYGTACLVCKEDHKACDGGRPCSRCVSLGIASSCQSSSRRKSSNSKEEGPFSGTLVFCLEEISIKPNAAAPTRSASPVAATSVSVNSRSSSPTNLNQVNFHYSSFSATQNTTTVPTQPTTSRRSPRKKAKPDQTPTAATTQNIVHSPPPQASFQQQPTQQAPRQLNDVKSEPIRPVSECKAEQPRAEVEQLVLLQQQLAIEREKQAKLRLKLQLRREQYEQAQMCLSFVQQQQPIPHHQYPQQFQQPSPYYSSQPNLTFSTQQPQPVFYAQHQHQHQQQFVEFELLQPMSDPVPPSTSNPKKRKHVPNRLNGSGSVCLESGYVTRPALSCGQQETRLYSSVPELPYTGEGRRSSSDSGEESNIEEGDEMTEADLMASWDSFFQQAPSPIEADKRFSASWHMPFAIADA